MIKQLAFQQDLSFEESYQLFAALQDLAIEQQAAILALLRAKHETVDEIEAGLKYFGQYSQAISHEFDLVDIVGTGGDAQNTFNISTAASILMASCQVTVAKHGGKSATSQAGSSDLMDALFIETPENAVDVLKQLNRLNYVYLRASHFNPLLGQFASLRKQLGIPTLFNILGPLLHPMSPERLVFGVYRNDLLSKIAEILIRRTPRHALVVHSEDGLDEISISSNTDIIEICGEKQKLYQLNPEDFGLKKASLIEIQGGGAYENAEMIRGIFQSEIKDARRDVLLLNAGAGLYVSGKLKSIREGIDMARQALDSGSAFHYLEQLRRKDG